MNDTYQHTLDALDLCVAAGIPAILWGNPGEGKTSMIESAAARGVHVETVILSQSEPSDLAGLPVVSPLGDVVLAPPIWARRLADHDGPELCFFDEFSTATPALQAAALRVLTHREVGNLQLPNSVTFVSAANPVEVSAAGWDLAAPTSSRFVHLDFVMTAEVFTRGSVTGDWPALRGRDRPDGSATIEFSGLRADRVFVVLQGVVAALGDDPRPERWSTALRLCCQAADQAGLDPAVPAVRALVSPERRPAGAPIPAEIGGFAPALTEAGLL